MFSSEEPTTGYLSEFPATTSIHKVKNAIPRLETTGESGALNQQSRRNVTIFVRSKGVPSIPKRPRFYDTVPIVCPTTDSASIMCYVTIQVTIQVKSTLSVVTQKDASHRNGKVMFSNEAYTTAKCSYCRLVRYEKMNLYAAQNVKKWTCTSP